MIPGGFWSGVKRFAFWDYARASWQYDIMVGLILAFIFFTPRELFRDQPRPKSVMLVASGQGSSQYLIEPDLLGGLAGDALKKEAERLIHSQAGGKNRAIQRLEPIFDDEKEIRGWIAYTRP